MRNILLYIPQRTPYSINSNKDECLCNRILIVKSKRFYIINIVNETSGDIEHSRLTSMNSHDISIRGNLN